MRTRGRLAARALASAMSCAFLAFQLQGSVVETIFRKSRSELSEVGVW